MREASNNHEHKNVQRNQINDKHISTPSRDHIKVGERSQNSPKHQTSLDALYPQIISKHERENSNSFVIIRAGNRATNITGHNTNKSSREQTRALTPQLFSQQISSYGSEAAKKRRQKHAHLSDMHSEI